MAPLLLKRLLVLVPLLSGATGCSQLFFFPASGLVRTPADIGLRYEDVYFDSSDGVRLHGWYLPASSRDRAGPRATVLHLHGNAENISTHIGAVYWLPAEGFEVFMFDYRGFGRSAGHPTVEGALNDSRAALALAASRAQAPIVVFGQSLGGSLAVATLADSPLRTRVRALILDSAFADYRLITRDKLDELWLTWPFQVPLSWLVDNGHSPLPLIERISPIPLLIAHAERDPIVPADHARRLFERAREPKTLWILPQAQHTALAATDDSRSRLLRYLDTLLQ